MADLRCPQCGAEPPKLHDWSDPAHGSYGVGCLDCELFIQFSMDGEIVAKPLDLAHFPLRHRTIPAYRNAVGWVDR